ncbi:MAG: response regulator [Candidatus Pacebacteria bacterium]|nr:response regulator [Candidatus Paceibacterota bacterium]
MLQKTILIIEDSTDLADSLEDVLLLKGYRPLKANNGKTGLDLALTEKPDLILLDLRLPDMDGIEIINHLKNDSWGKDVRILIITASDLSEQNMIDNNIKTEDVIHKSRSSISDIVLRVEKELA